MPKGITQAERRAHNKKKALCIAAIIHEYYIEQEKMCNKGKIAVYLRAS